MTSQRKIAANRKNAQLGGRPTRAEAAAADRLAGEILRNDVRTARLAAKKVLQSIKSGDFPAPTAPPTEAEINQTLAEIAEVLAARGETL